MGVLRGLARSGPRLLSPHPQALLGRESAPACPGGRAVGGGGCGLPHSQLSFLAPAHTILTEAAELIGELNSPGAARPEPCFVNLNDRSLLLLHHYYCQHPPQIHFAKCSPGGKSHGVGGRGLSPGLSLLGWPDDLGKSHTSRP